MALRLQLLQRHGMLFLFVLLIVAGSASAYLHHQSCPRLLSHIRASQKPSLNFEDGEVACTSEGGSWKVDVSTAISKSNLVSSDLQASDFPGIETWEATFSTFTTCLNAQATPIGVTELCDKLTTSPASHYRTRVLLSFFIKQKLAELLRQNPAAYSPTAAFLVQSNKIARRDLPNVQFFAPPPPPSSDNTADCTLPPTSYQDSILDKVLLGIFRNIVQSETKYTSPLPGIKGLLDEGKTYMLSEEGQANDSINQHAFVKRSLGRLMTPFLPPFYRLFMAGIVPSKERGDPDWLVSLFDSINKSFPSLTPGKQLGPWFYAPALTSIVTPPFLQFLVGPSRPNYRKDGQLGGLLVEKCKFLQESGCKGLCLHQCKIPAQEFFQETLGLSLTVQPNFDTQECQWSWGEDPLPHRTDPAWPKGCLVGCPTRLQLSSSSSSSSPSNS